MSFPDGASRPVPDPPDAAGRTAVGGSGGPRAGSSGTPVRPSGVRGPQPDAVRLDPDASYGRALAQPPVDTRERAVVSVQLGRPARGNPAVVHRCVYGLPTVVRVDPRLDDGTPFPTTYWLTCPVMRSRVGRLEADHAMVGLNDRLGTDAEFAAEYAAASERYVASRDRLGDPLPGNPSAGGMPGHVKCLHVHAGHALATGDNVVGQWTLEHSTPAPCRGPCVTEEEVAARMEREQQRGVS